MIALIFSFRGRVGRLRYFLSGLAVGFGLVAVLLPIFLAGGIERMADGPPRFGPIALLALPFIAVALWINLSLQARRFRDIGWEPLIVMPAWFGLGIVDWIIAKAAPALSVGAAHQGTWIGGLVNLVLTCALLFWPGRADDGGESFDQTKQAKVRDEVKQRALAASPRPAAAAQVRPAAAPGLRPAGATGGFGRRGL